jgi:hypothetical protein
MNQVCFTLFLSLLASPAAAIGLYQSQDAAQVHCRTDTVVWLNTHSGVGTAGRSTATENGQ